MKVSLVALALLCTLGCKNRLFFATKTSIGLEVSGTSQMPDKISFSASRYEGAVVPRSAKGDPYSVYGGLDADIQWLPPEYTIKQTFATGRAAQGAADDGNVPNDDKLGKSRDPLYFVTDTSLGIKLSAGKQDVSPTFLLGYKRVEGAVIPVDSYETEARSVYADIMINSANATNGISTNISAHNKGVRIQTAFATGVAADLAVQKKAVRDKLDAAAMNVSLDALQNQAVEGRPAILDHLISGNQVHQDKLDALAQALIAKGSALGEQLRMKRGETAANLKAWIESLDNDSIIEIAAEID